MNRDTAVTALQNAVAFLKGSKKIKKENEISLQTGFTKGSVSSYLSGNQTPSKNFIAKFEEVYKLKLVDFIQESPVVIKDTYGAGVEALIRIESQVKVGLSYIAEIYAQGANVPATKVLKEMELEADRQSLKKLEELRKKS